MSHSEEQADNIGKKKIKKRAAKDMNADRDLSKRETQRLGFDKFFLLVNGWEKIIIAAALSLFLCIPIVRYYSESTTLILVTLVVTTLFIFPLVVYLYVSSYYKSYIRLVQSGSTYLSGWNEAIGSLSADFWKGKSLAIIKIEIKPGNGALDEERKRLLEFCYAFVDEGSKIIQRATSTNFTIEIEFLAGKQSAFVVKKIFNELATVMNKIHSEKASVQISFNTEVTMTE